MGNLNHPPSEIGVNPDKERGGSNLALTLLLRANPIPTCLSTLDVGRLVSVILAPPFGKVIGDAIGISLFQTSLDYAVSVQGAVLWLVLVVIITVIASALPARSASRLTVREVLAYE